MHPLSPVREVLSMRGAYYEWRRSVKMPLLSKIRHKKVRVCHLHESLPPCQSGSVTCTIKNTYELLGKKLFLDGFVSAEFIQEIEGFPIGGIDLEGLAPDCFRRLFIPQKEGGFSV